MSTRASIVVLAVVCGCGDVVPPAIDAAPIDAMVGVDAAIDGPVAATICENPTGLHTVFINTNGGTYTPASGGVSSPAANTATSANAADTLAGWQVSAAVNSQMMQCLRETYRAYNVEFTDQEPATEPYYEVVITSDAATTLIGANVLSIGELGCPPLEQSITFIFATVSDDPLTICQSAASTLGFSAGTSRVTPVCEDVMTATYECPTQTSFVDTLQECGRTMPMPCNCDGAMSQNSHRILLNAFGACP